MSYHLGDSRRGGGEPAAAAARSVILSVRPDILALQAIGPRTAVSRFRETLAGEGLVYDHLEAADDTRSPGQTVILSRFPIAARHSRRDLGYRIKSDHLVLSHGIADTSILVDDRFLFRLAVVHLKDKSFHPLGQTEMRRNECRLVARHLRDALTGTPDALMMLAGTFNDRPGSAALHELTRETDPPPLDLRPTDQRGDAWTSWEEESDTYHRHDYFFAVPRLVPLVVREETHIIDPPSARIASPHRPLLATLRIPGRDADRRRPQ